MGFPGFARGGVNSGARFLIRKSRTKPRLQNTCKILPKSVPESVPESAPESVPESARVCTLMALGSRACIMSSTLYNSLDDGFRCSSCLTNELTTFWLKGAICISGAESVLAVLLAQDFTSKFIGTCGAQRKSTEWAI